MADRHLPVHPNLEQLKHQAKDLLRQIRRGDPVAVAEFRQFGPEAIEPASAKLAQVQFALARSYGVASWPRLVLACRLIDAIWDDDVERIRELLRRYPALLHEMARGTERCNWGPPLSYAANLGRDAIIRLLHELGAADHGHAFIRASLQGKIETARMLHDMLGKQRPPEDCLQGPAYTLSASGTRLLFELGARVRAADGRPLAPVDVVLETDSRKPAAKHEILELYVQHGFELPDTPPMAVHRGRIELLEKHLRRDPGLLTRKFSHESSCRLRHPG